MHLGAGREQDHVRLALAASATACSRRAARPPPAPSRCGRTSGASAGVSASADGAALPLDRDPPGHRRLVRVGRADVPEVRDRPERHVVLDGLVRRAVLADPDRVVRPDPDRLEPHQRAEAHGGAHVVGEDEEGRAERLQHRRVEGDAVDDRPHRVLADAEGDVAARVGRREDARALVLGLRRLDEVGGAADRGRA